MIGSDGQQERTPHDVTTLRDPDVMAQLEDKVKERGDEE